MSAYDHIQPFMPPDVPAIPQYEPRGPVEDSPWRPGGIWENEKVDTSNMDRSGLNSDIATMTDISKKPIRFNPPLHPMSRPVRVDFGSDDPYTAGDYAAEKKPSVKNAESARLGRIIQSENALGGGGHERNVYRWGFRFQYNPTNFQTSTAMNPNVQIDSTSPVALHLSSVHTGGLQAHTIPLVLNRIADLESRDLNVTSYGSLPQSPTGEDLKKIKTWGTMWDLEYLFRCANGAWETEDLGMSGNIGILQPNPVYLFLGPGIKHYGFIYNIQYQHKRFTIDMIPTLTDVTLSYSRIVYIDQETADEWKQAAGYYVGDFDYDRDDASSGDDGGGGSSADPPTGNAPSPSPSQIWDDPSIPHGGNAGGKVTNSTNYMFRTLWAQFGSGFIDAHCWRANGHGSPTHPGGHACDFVVSSGHASGSAKAHGDKVAAWLVDNAEALGVCYIIWYRKIWNVNKKSEGWRHYSGSDGTANNDHTNHVHVTTVTDPRC